MKESAKVCAGIVVYKPSLPRLSNVLGSISHQVNELIVVVNGLGFIGEVKHVCEEYKNVVLISNQDNEGIAKALNQICRCGAERGYRWVLTLDQDTICPSNLVEELYRRTNQDGIGIVCPAVHYEGIKIDAEHPNEGVEYVKACMTSASLTSIEAWDLVDGFNESYFIDYVDNEFCMKLSMQGFKILRTFSCCISHQLGESNEIHILWWKLKGTHHNEIRCYYMMRNNILFLITYSAHLKILKEILKIFYVAFGEVLYSPNRLLTIKYIARGIFDGVKRQTGKKEFRN